MRRAPVHPIGAIVGALCCALAAGPLAAEPRHPIREASLFKILKLEGHQVRWSLPADGSPRVITYRLVTNTLRFPNARNCRGLAPLDALAAASGVPPAALKEEARAAFAMWEAAASLVFKEAPESGPADILIGAQTEPEGWAFADVFYDADAPGAVKPISQALVCLNPGKRWKVGFDGDLKTYDLRYTLAHEIGHAIGLDHPVGGSQIMHFKYEERFRALQPGDIGGAVSLYGAPPQPTLVAAAGQQRVDAVAPEGPVGGRALGK
ncbi:MAG: matrixin family metalloprotease [Hyphomicrobiaceae bacterium]